MKKIYKYVVIAAFAAMTPLVAQAPAAAPAQEPGFHKHDGFYLNLMGGFGTAGYSNTVGTTSVKIGGFAGHFGIKLGGALTNNLILFGALDGFSALSPTFTVGSSSATVSSATYSINTYGAGIAYYSDSNFFLAASAGAARGTLAYTSGTTAYAASTDTGFGANLNIGMEWWVSANWGLGVAAVGHFSSVKDGGTTATQYYAGIAFTATYN